MRWRPYDAIRSLRSGRALILIYHRVRLARDPLFPEEVDAAAFDRHMLILKRLFSPLSLVEAIAGLATGTLPPAAVCVTFDDGYADNESVALPILLRHGIPATFFVATKFLDGGRMWNDTVIETFRNCADAEMDLVDLGLGRVKLGSGTERGRAAAAVLTAIKHRRPAERAFLADDIASRIDGSLPTDLMMTSDQVRKLADAGMEIGAHTDNHPILALLSDEEARTEIERSRKILEHMTGKAIRSFAYPNGRPLDDYTLRDRAIVEACGFDCAVSTRRGVATRQSDRYQLPRLSPWDSNIAKWSARLLLEFGNPQ